ncbi:MAG: aminoglycoside phosphotransferase family protein [Deltaproteobacteria bacterium]|nr:aminoglycoside phosphotransferase family protein [Deltaproteobacteria bacterium]
MDDDTARWLRAEWTVYEQIQGTFLPAVVAWVDGSRPVLVLENLSHGHWPPPWSDAMVTCVARGLAQIGRTTAPPGLPRLETLRETLCGWRKVRADPKPFLNLGLCSRRWLESSLPTFLDAEEQVELGGESLVHLDVRSDNLCLLQERAVFVDWSCAHRGNALIDKVFWAPNLHMEGGPSPGDFVGYRPEHACLVAGFFAAHASLRADTPNLERIRMLQLGQLRIALPWACASTGVTPPDPR